MSATLSERRRAYALENRRLDRLQHDSMQRKEKALAEALLVLPRSSKRASTRTRTMTTLEDRQQILGGIHAARAVCVRLSRPCVVAGTNVHIL